mmetsp:Transcript_2775/g.3948  ORF Transcript_2775/g.3948 Transcript_2775/m.3948 type:complete len:350 (-) Transcript_2775:83-1132(-)|eukprot:CAMPEP_0117084658 /NCGR_PEP_ID=MMETSP0472-20121206/59576_1 /TAXON_ID=693140 ORGANISM="Tiarina fusus, Strain LIS" /NCGR_SAMPLE_ID=MMETSP0472 /ASSEMBLY_ACC=CAM_ASM_000603 /LENGTH=349 /DNA_ID=CAMNT_0004813723 /DNA_START=181 /DNA_END=1230 /DNA_ORIENTATION=+
MKIERLRALIENPTYTRKKLRLNDGRILSYSECGNIKKGLPVLFCFGLMTSSVAIMFAHDHALQANLRILAVDYPGIGESTFQEDRTLGGWADDMHQFLDQLCGRHSKVRLLGHSMGGLHVLALLSSTSFKARVTRTVLLSPWFHIEGEEYNSVWMNVAQRMPEFVQSSIIPAVLTNVSSGSMQLLGWSNPQHTTVQAASMVTTYSMLQGQAGNEQMVRFALSKTEMYIPQDVENSIIIYHGGKDGLVLGKSVKELVRLLKERNCRPRLVRIHDADHNSVMSDFDNLTKVMRSLLGEADDWSTELFKSVGNKIRSMPHQARPKDATSTTVRKEAKRRKARSMTLQLGMR